MGAVGNRNRAGPGVAALLALTALFAWPHALEAQLRPLDPLPWTLFQDGRALWVRAGVGAYAGQRASLAGTEGRLVELLNVAGAWRTGRVALQAAGTVLRLFEDRRVFADPTGGAEAPGDALRLDSGDYRISTLVRLTNPGARPLVVLRFGARLPTTDNRVGLDRDRTDFFATLGASLSLARWSVRAESGVGIHGTREVDYEQSDVLVYAATLAYRHPGITPVVHFVGQEDGLRGRTIRGNEDLREVRVGIRAGGARRVTVEVVWGFTAVGPEWGLRVTLGFDPLGAGEQ